MLDDTKLRQNERSTFGISHSSGFYLSAWEEDKYVVAQANVSLDERLKITDTAAGVYDVKFVDKTGRTCVVPNIEVRTGAVFTIEEKTLKDCAK